MLSSLMGNLICALMVNGRALIVGKALDLLQTSRMSIVMVGSKSYIFIPSSITHAVKRKNYFATSRLWLK